jgi:hypothetical protein
LLRPVVQVGGKSIGDGHPFFVIAEASSNHNRDLKTALGLIDAAAAAGADAVKFQAFTADRIVARMREKHPYIQQMFPEAGSMHEVYASMELPREWLKDLKARAEERGLVFLCTPSTRRLISRIARLAAYKIASYELWHPLIRHAARPEAASSRPGWATSRRSRAPAPRGRGERAGRPLPLRDQLPAAFTGAEPPGDPHDEDRLGVPDTAIIDGDHGGDRDGRPGRKLSRSTSRWAGTSGPDHPSRSSPRAGRPCGAGVSRPSPPIKRMPRASGPAT